MSNLSDSEILSSEHYEFLQLNQVGRLSVRVSKAVDADERSLREFNAELLQRIGDYRKKNLELSASENDLRAQLATQEKQASERERELTRQFETELTAVKKSLSEAQLANVTAIEDWTHRLQTQTLRQQEESDQSRTREAQMTKAYEALRAEYAKIDQCYAAVNESVPKLQNDLREREIQATAELQELTDYLTAKAANDLELVRTENIKLREHLNVRDSRHDTERASLQSWRDQLTQTDTQLKHFADKLLRNKQDLIRLTKLAEDEVRFSLKNPFTDYLDMAELEVEQVRLHLSTTSNLSPLKAKLEARLQASVSHRDGINSILERADAQLAAHAKSIQTILKSLEFLV